MLVLMLYRTPHQAILGPEAGDALARLADLPPLRLNVESTTATATAEENKRYPPFLPGAGLSRRVLDALKDVPSGAIAAWVVEGDNRGDARALALAALHVLDVGECRYGCGRYGYGWG
jgi:proteasome assembly chaperone 2